MQTKLIILKIDEKTNRVSASIKALTEDPYEKIEKKYKVGDKVNDHVSMLNWVSSKQNTKQYNQSMLNLFKVALSFKNSLLGK